LTLRDLESNLVVMNARAVVGSLLRPRALVSAGCGGSKAASDPKPMTIKFGFTVAPGEEKTQCYVTHLDNPELYDFERVDSHMTAGSHHLILYRDASSLTGGTAPAEGIGDCNMGGARLFVYTTQDADHSVAMPKGVAGQLPAHALVILEAHYVNASAEPLQASAEVTITPARPGTIQNYAGIIFYLDTAFSVPPGAGMNGAPEYTHSTTCAVPEGIHVFRMGSHTHKHATDFRIDQVTDTSAGFTGQIYENKSWSNPKELDFPDDAPLNIGANQSFRFSCSWTNDSAVALEFGESAVNNEMCIMGAGYWPRVSGPMNLGGNVLCLDGTLYY
jgi:hypothetical protein